MIHCLYPHPHEMRITTIALATTLFALAACGGNSPWRPEGDAGGEGPDIATLEVSAEGNEAVDWRGAGVAVTVTSSADWVATCTDDWCTVQPASGKGGTSTIAVNVAANGSAAERQTALQVASGNRKASVKITQRAKPELIFSSTALTFGSAKGSQVMVLKSNVAWSATCADDWCTVSPASGMTGTTAVTVSAGQNASGAERQTTITIDADGAIATVSVAQSAS